MRPFATFLRESPQHAEVEYYAISPSGNRAWFKRGIPLLQVRNAQSETAIYFYLKQLHPRAEIQIQNLRFI